MNKPLLLPRLSVMMFLQYAVWGAWLPVAGRYLSAPVADGGLGFSAAQIGMILGLAGSIGAIASPFIAGQLCDRFFRTERVLAVLLVLGGVIKWITAGQTSYEAWLWLSILYSVVYMPTLALSNSLAFSHLTDERRQFPLVRVWGTLGWIAASWVFPWIYLQSGLQFQSMPPFLSGTEHPDVVHRLVDSMKFSAIISWGYAVFCLCLPATPPKKDAVEPLAFRKAFGLLAHPSFAVLVVGGLIISSIHQIYFIQAPGFLPSLGLKDSNIGPAMTVGQFAEILAMAGLGFALKGIGFRAVLSIGALAYVLRYAIWGVTAQWVSKDPSASGAAVTIAVSSLVLHGLCYACFFAASYIYVDRLAPKDIRHSAQTVFSIIMLGGGPVIGGWLQGKLLALPAYQVAALEAGGSPTPRYDLLWFTLSGAAVLALALMAALFRDETREQEPDAG